VENYICTYEYTRPALEAAAAVICFPTPAPGFLPVRGPNSALTIRQRRWAVDVWRFREGDLDLIGDLWLDNFGKLWPCDADTLKRLLIREGFSKHFVVIDPNSRDSSRPDLLGFCATFCIPFREHEWISCLALLMVRTSHRGLGIGLTLHDVAMKEMKRARGLSRLHLGSSFPRIFPGMPTELPAADQDWFQRRGWQYEERQISDFALDMTNWKSSPPEAIAGNNISFSICSPAKKQALMSFLERYFNHSKYPGWIVMYKRTISDPVAAERDIVIATQDNSVVAAGIIYVANDHTPVSQDILWAKMLSPAAGGVTCISVHRM
jgi:beta-N-acetylhexosaminidase